MNEWTGTKSYWKSLERLHDSPAVREVLDEEFPEGASLSPRGLMRRRMLQLMGASFALAGAASCRRPEETIVPFTEAPEDYVPGVAKHYASTMTLGAAAYGVLVESHEGRPTKIEGNELHPASRGAASAWMQAAILGLYDPDRSSVVLRRPDPSAELSASSWDAFADGWRAAAVPLESTGGRGLAVLTEAYASPSLAKLKRDFQQRFPNATWAVYEPFGDENVFAGSKLATGRALRPLYHLERAKRILSLDGDVLGTETGALTNATGFAASRKSANVDMNRLYVVESTLTSTGANADHRIPLPSHQMPLFLAHLAAALDLPPTASLPSLDAGLARAVRVIAEDLDARRGEAVIVVGRHQPPEVHAAALVLNEALGALGATLTLNEPLDTEWGDTAALVALVGAMKRGEVDTLVMLGGNPVYDAPADLDFAGAMADVETTVHLSSHVDETSRLARWHLPRAHFLESWGDARALDGTPSLVQPLVAPLFEGRTVLETLGLLVTDDHRDGFGLVRDVWLPGIFADEQVEAKWNRTLHDGWYASDADTMSVSFASDGERRNEVLKALAERVPEPAAGFELLFTPSPAVHDGRFANNGWLQELPDPTTKLTWDNAALVSPHTAEELGLQSEDRVSIHNGSSHVDVPVLVSPGQADGSISLSLGYGRWAAGRVGNGVGVNAHGVRNAIAPFVQTGVAVRKEPGRHALAITQQHWSMEGREPIRESTGDPHIRIATEPRHDDAPPLWDESRLDGEFQWGMVIDLNTCQGCNACVVACQAENNIPVVGKEQVLRGREMQWLRVDRYFSGSPEGPEVSFQPVPCMHCENAPCEQVCPVGATVHDREGINAMVYNRCIGTRYCSNNCPYKVRRFNFFNYTKDIPEITSMAMNPNVTVRSRGVMEKCTYCIQRINETKRSGRPMMTACQQTCPAKAITFGNLVDRESAVAKLKESARNYVLLEELFLEPRTSYLTKVRNPNPAWFRI